jgi:hypothetical protein
MKNVPISERHRAVRSTSMADKYYDTEKMAEIILVLIQNFGNDRMIKFMIGQLIRNESDNLVPSRKSAGVLGMEKIHGVSLAGLTRDQIYPKSKDLSGDIVIEHGLPIGQALDMCLEMQNKENIKLILEEIKDNLVYITKSEDKLLNKKVSSGTPRPKGPSDFYWEEAYGICGIKLVDNPNPEGHGPGPGSDGSGPTPPSIPGGVKISKSQAMAMVNQKYGLDLTDSNTMFSSINAAVKQWGFDRKNNHFNDDTHMILSDQDERKIHYFFMKGGTIKEPGKMFKQRTDKRNTSVIVIPVSAYNFKEKHSGFLFGDYKKDTIKH